MRSKALAVQSILEMTENRAKCRPVSGHPPPRMYGSGLRIDKRVAWLMTLLRSTILLKIALRSLLVGCSSGNKLLVSGRRQ
jgi:hypothetical protein